MRSPSRDTYSFSWLLVGTACLVLSSLASVPGWAQDSLGVTMTATVRTEGDGSFDVTYVIRAANLGSSELSALQIEGDLRNVFSQAAFEVVSATSGQGTVREDYDGREARSLLSGTEALGAGAAIDVILVVRVTVGSDRLTCANSVVGTARTADGTLVTDVSEQGTNPDPDQDADPSNNNAPTVVVLDPRPVVGLAKASVSALIEDDEYSVTYTFVVRNLGQVTLNAVCVEDNLLLAFPEPALVRVSELASSDFDVNPSYDGADDVRLLSGTDVLLPNRQGTILLSLSVLRNGGGAWFQNRAVARATGPSGTTAEDASQEGANPDPDGDADPTQNDVPTGTLLARVSTSGSLDTTIQAVPTPLEATVSSMVLDGSIQIDSFSARLNARLTDTIFDLLTLSASGTLGTCQLTSSLIFNPTTLSFVSWQTSGSVSVFGARLTDTVYIASTPESSYDLLRATGEVEPFAFDVSAKFGVCPFGFWEASLCADWAWDLCATPLQACLSFDETGFLSFDASATEIPILQTVFGEAALLDVTVEFTATAKTLTTTLRYEPRWFVCPDFRLLGGIDLGGEGGVAGISIYGLEVECPIGDLIFRMADSFDDSKNATITGESDFFELFEIEGPFPSCCGTPGEMTGAVYFERSPTPSGALFGVGLLSGSVEFRVASQVAVTLSAEFTPVAPHWLLSARVRVSW